MQASWYTQELRMTKRHCKQLERRLRASQEKWDKDMFKSTQRRYHQQIWETKQKAQADHINKSSNGSKHFFPITKDFTTPAATLVEHHSFNLAFAISSPVSDKGHDHMEHHHHR